MANHRGRCPPGWRTIRSPAASTLALPVTPRAVDDARHLTLDQLRVQIGAHRAVERVSLEVQPDSVHCLVGDSGSGKTLTSLAAVGLLPVGATASGAIRLTGVDDDLLTLDQERWSDLRGRLIGYVGQNALGCLHPAFRIERQLVEAIRRHRSVSRSEAGRIARDELAAVELDPDKVANAHPAELSGGMCQRVALAMALCNRPSVLIADEPTTALDDTTQDHVLDLIRAKVDDDGLSVLLITHDHRVVERMADEVTTIAEGVSSHTRSAVTGAATTAERSARTDPEAGETAETPVLQIDGVSKTYESGGWRRRPAPPVLSDVTISADTGTTIGLVGRSGAGKTTLAQIVAGVLSPTEGTVHIDGRSITGPDRVGRLEKAGLVQYVFQDPFGSLNPRRTSVAQVAEPLIVDGVDGEQARARATELLGQVGLTEAQTNRLPTKLSGGQCQRVGIARALIRRPKVVVLDEPVSALDWSIRAEILAILNDLQDTVGALYLLISHEMSLIERQSDRIYQVTAGQVQPL